MNTMIAVVASFVNFYESLLSFNIHYLLHGSVMFLYYNIMDYFG